MIGSVIGAMHSLREKIRHRLRGEYYEIDGFRLKVGYDHKLPFLQKYYPMYDRFLPCLAQHLADCGYTAKEKYIIDVGANVGDTVASMIRGNDARFICVEADDHFFEVLKSNVGGFGREYSDRITCVKTFIVDRENEGKRFGNAIEEGTAHRTGELKEEKDTGAQDASMTIETLLKSQDIAPDEVALVKTDTDGYDAECMMSMGDGLKKGDPLLFWENQVEDRSQYDSYVKMYEYLSKMGYEDFFCFDNYGNFLCKTGPDGLKSIMDYLLRMKDGRSPRTFWYVDVLACRKDRCGAVEKVVDGFLGQF